MPSWLRAPAAERPPDFESPFRDGAGRPLLGVWRLRLRSRPYAWLRYADGTEFLLDHAATRVWAAGAPGATLEDTTTYLLGPVLGLVLRLRGLVALHASAVVIGERVVAFAGPSRSGKSTTATALARLGHAVLSDDIVPLLAQGVDFLVPPAAPQLCIWPDSVCTLFGSPEALPRLTPNWEKRFLPLGRQGFRFQEQPLPLGAIYFLGPRAEGAASPCVRALGANEGMISLVSNTYVNYLLDRTLRAREFRFLGQVAARVPLRLLTLSHSLAAVPGMCDAVLTDLRSLGSLAA